MVSAATLTAMDLMTGLIGGTSFLFICSGAFAHPIPPFVGQLGLFISALIMMEIIQATDNLGNPMC